MNRRYLIPSLTILLTTSTCFSASPPQTSHYLSLASRGIDIQGTIHLLSEFAADSAGPNNDSAICEKLGELMAAATGLRSDIDDGFYASTLGYATNPQAMTDSLSGDLSDIVATSRFLSADCIDSSNYVQGNLNQAGLVSLENDSAAIHKILDVDLCVKVSDRPENCN